MTQTTALHFFVSNSMRDHLLLYQSQWDKRQKKKKIRIPSKAPGNIMEGKYSREVSRESKTTETFAPALLHYSWHNLFPIDYTR